jgi:hypothetical protein
MDTKWWIGTVIIIIIFLAIVIGGALLRWHILFG